MSHVMGATHGRKTQSRKMKHDASNTLGGRTKKQRDTPRALQVGYRKHSEQPLSGKSHTRRDFFGFCSTVITQKNPSLHRQEVLQLRRERSPHPSMPTSTELSWKLYPCRVK
jgi:hypothetical protein